LASLRDEETSSLSSSVLLLLVLQKGLGALGQFVRRDIFLVRGDHPTIARGIFHPSAAVAIEHVSRFHDRLATSLDGLLVHGIDIRT
jgi:hypothetical protein